MSPLPLLVFSHLRWDFVYQRPQHLLSRFAQGQPVFVIEEPVYGANASTHWERQSPRPGVTVFRPHTPCPEGGFVDAQLPYLTALVERLVREENLTRCLLWMYTPMALPLTKFFETEVVIYDCMDELSAFDLAPPQLIDRERQPLERADVVFTGGPSLYRAKQGRHPNVHLFSSSVDAEHFRQAFNRLPEPEDHVHLSHPRLGYFGVIDERIDRLLLAHLAASHPEWHVILIGPAVKIDPAALPQAPNLHYLGQRSYQALPAYLAGWDVCLLPFACNAATRFISPTKTLEYMAAERPIVSTPITDVQEPYGDIVYLGGTPEAFAEACERALASSQEERARRGEKMRSVLKSTSWDSTVADFPHLSLHFEVFFVISWRSVTISSPSEERLMPDQPTYRSQVLDHLGLVAGMFDELGIGDVIDQATQQNPEMRDLTTGEAVKAMVLNGRGFINQALYLVPRFFQNKPTYRLISPRVAPDQLNDDALGRALDTLYADGVTELYSLLAATAAERLGLTPRFAHLDSTSFHVDGRYNRDEEPEAQVIHITRGYSRDHRPDLNHVMWELIVEHQAGIPLLRQPLSGNSSDVQEFGQVIRTHIEQLHTTSGVTSIVADSALYSEANLQKLAQTAMKWITRVPATLSEAQAALAQVDPQALASLQEGYRYHELTSTYGGMAQRWVLIYSEPRQLQAQRTIDRQRRQQSDADVKALKKLCRSTFACEADARQALATFEQDLQATCLSASWIRATPRDGTRGRPRHGTQPEPLVDQIDGALASSLLTRQALIDQQSCFILATHELDTAQLPSQEVLAGYKGQGHVERGFRLLKDPQFLASSLYLKKPERMMALLMVMTVCLLVYAALEYRIRKALKDHEATFPDQKGKRIQHPTARWVFHDVVGIHWRCQAGQWPMVLNLTEAHQHLLRLLGKPYMQFYDVRYS